MNLTEAVEKFKRWMVTTFPHIGSGGSSRGHPLYILFTVTKNELDAIWEAVYELRGAILRHDSVVSETSPVDTATSVSEDEFKLLEERLNSTINVLNEKLIMQDEKIQKLMDDLAQQIKTLSKLETEVDNLIELIVVGGNK